MERLFKSVAIALLTIVVTVNFANANPYEKYKGKTIVVSWPALSHFQKAEKLIEEFTKETGINVEVDALQYLKLRDRQILEMSKPRGEVKQPAGGNLVTGLSTGCQSRCARSIEFFEGSPKFVISFWRLNSLLLQDVLSIGENGCFGAKRYAIKGTGFSGHIPLFTADNTTILQISIGDIVNIVLRIDQGAVGEELAERCQKAFGYILALPHDDP